MKRVISSSNIGAFHTTSSGDSSKLEHSYFYCNATVSYPTPTVFLAYSSHLGLGVELLNVLVLRAQGCHHRHTLQLCAFNYLFNKIFKNINYIICTHNYFQTILIKLRGLPSLAYTLPRETQNFPDAFHQRPSCPPTILEKCLLENCVYGLPHRSMSDRSEPHYWPLLSLVKSRFYGWLTTTITFSCIH